MPAVPSCPVGDDIAASEIEASRAGQRRRGVEDHDMRAKARVPMRGRFDGEGARIKKESRDPNGEP